MFKANKLNDSESQLPKSEDTGFEAQKSVYGPLDCKELVTEVFDLLDDCWLPSLFNSCIVSSKSLLDALFDTFSTLGYKVSRRK
jgi:hypothetical protein